jgi:hypothetical protein
LSQGGIPCVRFQSAALARQMQLVNEAAGGKIGWSWHPLSAPRRRTFVRARPGFRLTINFLMTLARRIRRRRKHELSR